MHLRHLLGGALATVLLLLPVAGAEWSDDFDSYAVGSGMIGQGGWEGWDASPAADAYVSDLYAFSSPHSVEIVPTSDLIHQFTGYTSGAWVFTAYVYVPTDFSGQSYFLLLNTYNHGGPYNWSSQVMFDSGGFVESYPEGVQLPLITGQWVELMIEIDLDLDVQTFYYGGTMLYEKSWIDGVSGGGEVNIACVDLYGNNASPVYYDDCSLIEDGTVPVENTTWGGIKGLYR